MAGGGESTLHVGAAPAVELSIQDFRLEGLGHGPRQRLDGYHVHMTGDHDRFPAARPLPSAHQILPAFQVPGQEFRVGRVLRKVRGGKLVNRKPQRLVACAQPLLPGGFVSVRRKVDGRDADEVAGQRNQRLPVALHGLRLPSRDDDRLPAPGGQLLEAVLPDQHAVLDAHAVNMVGDPDVNVEHHVGQENAAGAVIHPWIFALLKAGGMGWSVQGTCRRGRALQAAPGTCRRRWQTARPAPSSRWFHPCNHGRS